MYRPYVDVLGACARAVYHDMTASDVMSVKIERRQCIEDSLPVAQVIEYQGREDKLGGAFVLGFARIAAALSLAGALAAKMGLPAPTQLDDVALDLLNEFMNTVVGRTISAWDRMGMPVEFGPASPLRQANVAMQEGYAIESYGLNLDMALDRLSFLVTFSQALADGAAPERRVLVVEDSRTLRLFIEKTLKAAGYQVAGAGDGMQALEVFRKFEPHLVLTDLVMPKMGGLDAVMAMREQDPGVGFVVLTSSDRRDEVVTAKTLGVLAYLLKPVDSEKLLKTVADSFKQCRLGDA